jgi:putative Mg2+ transporter-C (MgtC) family protein
MSGTAYRRVDMPLTTELFAFPPVDQIVHVAVRLVLAAGLAGILGVERQAMGKAAGTRTHMLVALGAALFVLAVSSSGVEGDVSRVIQGVAAGIGFIGAGSILKHVDRGEVTGLTTAASIWMAAAIGVTAALASIWFSVLATGIAWLVLDMIERVSRRPKDSEHG